MPAETPCGRWPPPRKPCNAAGRGPSSLAQDPELLSDFILESREHLATVESQSMVLEQNPADAEAIHAIFRGFHTIKGLAGFLELPRIQEIAHEVETLLDRARNGQMQITPDVIDVMLAGADYLRESIDQVEASLHGRQPPDPPAERGVRRAHPAIAGNGNGGSRRSREQPIAAASVAESARGRRLGQRRPRSRRSRSIPGNWITWRIWRAKW